jgi:transposase-like protein
MIVEQEASGASIRDFCEQRGISVHSFYSWRRRLRQKEPVQFALLKTVAGKEPRSPVELFLPGGERLSISIGVDAATLRIVLDALGR